MMRACALVFLLLALAGCAGVGDQDGRVVAGSTERWNGVIINGELLIERGATLIASGGLRLDGPLRVEGRLVLETALVEFRGRPEDARIIIDGGELHAENSAMVPPPIFSLSARASVEWSSGELSIAGWRGEDSLLNVSDARVVVRTDAPLDAYASSIRIVNSSFEGGAISADAATTMRIVNVGMALDRFHGEGKLERAWHALVIVERPLGAPVAGVNVTAASLVGSTAATTGNTGSDGVAYMELVELVKQGNLLDPQTPHRFDVAGSSVPTVAAITTEEQEVRISPVP